MRQTASIIAKAKRHVCPRPTASSKPLLLLVPAAARVRCGGIQDHNIKQYRCSRGAPDFNPFVARRIVITRRQDFAFSDAMGRHRGSRVGFRREDIGAQSRIDPVRVPNRGDPPLVLRCARRSYRRRRLEPSYDDLAKRTGPLSIRGKIALPVFTRSTSRRVVFPVPRLVHTSCRFSLVLRRPGQSGCRRMRISVHGSTSSWDPSTPVSDIVRG